MRDILIVLICITILASLFTLGVWWASTHPPPRAEGVIIGTYVTNGGYTHCIILVNDIRYYANSCIYIVGDKVLVDLYDDRDARIIRLLQ